MSTGTTAAKSAGINALNSLPFLLSIATLSENVGRLPRTRLWVSSKDSCSVFIVTIVGSSEKLLPAPATQVHRMVRAGCADHADDLPAVRGQRIECFGLT